MISPKSAVRSPGSRTTLRITSTAGADPLDPASREDVEAKGERYDNAESDEDREGDTRDLTLEERGEEVDSASLWPLLSFRPPSPSPPPRMPWRAISRLDTSIT